MKEIRCSWQEVWLSPSLALLWSEPGGGEFRAFLSGFVSVLASLCVCVCVGLGGGSGASLCFEFFVCVLVFTFFNLFLFGVCLFLLFPFF